MVLLVTGKCDENCWYCPLSKEKRGHDVVYADELKVMKDEDIIEEAKSIDAEGTGITGGDPLISNTTFRYISLLKSEFGDDHHIHLYTSTTELDRIRRAEEEGLDEIRFHPPLDVWSNIDDSEFIPLLKLLNDYDIDVGLEVPVIPGLQRELRRLIETAAPYVDFINLNELEFSSTNWEELTKRGLIQAGDVSSSVKGSQEIGLAMLKHGYPVPLHYCSSSFKDGVQLTNRIKRRARNVAKPGDIVTEEGMLIRGIILCEDPLEVKDKIQKTFGVPAKLIRYDREKERVEVCLEVLERIHGELPYDCFGIEEYPTADRLEVERWPL